MKVSSKYFSRRYSSTKNYLNRRKTLYLIFLIVFFLTVGYSSLGTTLSLRGQIFVKIDKIVPVVEYSILGGIYNTNQTIMVTPFDNESGVDYYSIYVYKDNNLLNSYENLETENYEITLSESGTYEIRNLVVDKFGNIINMEPLIDGMYYQTYLIDKEKPTLTADITYIDGTEANITIIAEDNVGGSDLSNDNNYQYCISSSNSTDGCVWNNYSSSESFIITGDNEVKYLFVYPIKDNAENISGDNEDITIPYLIETCYFDLIDPTLTVSSTESGDNITITATDELSGLSEENVYKYYLSTSSTSLTGGSWIEYSNGEAISINLTQDSYLWIYPVKDKVGNVNDNKVFEEPYVIKTLYKIYTITYDLAGGTLSIANPSEYTSETDAFTLTNPTKTGYTFAGWTGTGLSSASTSVTISKGSTGDKNYIATWTPTTYTITYNLNSGTQASGAKTSYTIETTTFSLPTPTRTGYTFGGWYTSSGLTGTAVTQIAKGSTGNKTYYAKWTPTTYAITYNLNSGTQASGAKTSYTIETTTFSLPTPTRTGYTFGGWYTSSGLTGTAVTQIAKGSTGNKTYYAKWTPVSYTITYNLNGGSATNPTTYTIETATFTLKNPTRTGYTFAGWTGTGLSSASTSVSVSKGSTGNRSYTANWTANTYTITYNCNGGSGSTASSTHSYGVSQALTPNGCYKLSAGTGTGTSATPMAYTFVGWSTSSTATSATYTDGQSVTDLKTSGNVTLYAVWKKAFTYSKKYEVINDGNGKWRVKFLESGTFIPSTNTTIDVFLVGGGGSGAGGWIDSAGGGGGYTTTTRGITITANSSYTITVGTGGASTNVDGRSNNGTASTAFGYTAAGGKGAAGRTGGAGGSGGGAGTYTPNSDYTGSGGAGGSYGNNGRNGANPEFSGGGTGQGRTTCEFEQGTTTGCNSGVAAYAGGGGGRGQSGGAGGGGSGGVSGTANTGGGGGGSSGTSGAGGSGIVIIRNSEIMQVGNMRFTYTGLSEIIDDGSGNWRIRFLSSGTFKPLTSAAIDVFLVGGGGSGAGGWIDSAGGGGGYTKTQKNISINANGSYTITIGTGGASTNVDAKSNDGTASTAFGYTAAGGKGAAGRTGGAGGSGGGAGSYTPNSDYTGSGGAGGSYGSNGKNGANPEFSGGGAGQGSTTCEFDQGTTSGCNNGVAVYAGGGGGIWQSGGAGGGGGGSGINGTDNTGGGGGASTNTSGRGGSGIVIIRNKR